MNLKPEEARAARLAAVRARRADRPALVEQTTTVADLRPGDFVVRIPGGDGLSGVRCDAILEDVSPDYQGRILSRSTRLSVPASVLVFALHRESVVYPDAFPVVVRRPAR